MRCFPNVDIVISSTWREQFDLNSLRARFSSDIALRIIGVTPLSADLLPANKPKTRECEIINWLQLNNRQGEEWIAIDDCAWQFHMHKDRLIACKGYVGMDPDVEAKLRLAIALRYKSATH